MEIIIGIVSLIVLICFFNLCSNVSKIKTLLEKPENENEEKSKKWTW